ncbi:MAG: hypothetical protein RX318_12220 [bacterium]|nr:hypothetical protein [bacterium]
MNDPGLGRDLPPTLGYWDRETRAALRRMISTPVADPWDVDEMIATVMRDRAKTRGRRYSQHVRKREAAKIRRILEVALADKQVFPL